MSGGSGGENFLQSRHFAQADPSLIPRMLEISHTLCLCAKKLTVQPCLLLFLFDTLDLLLFHNNLLVFFQPVDNIYITLIIVIVQIAFMSNIFIQPY